MNHNIWQTVLAYMLLIVTVALGLLVALGLQGAVLAVVYGAELHRYTARAFNMLTIVAVGLLLLILLILTEHRYRTARTLPQLSARFCQFTGVQLAVLGMAHGVRVFGLWLDDVLVVSWLLLALVELALGITLLRICPRLRARHQEQLNAN